jgi:hypothetical protein
MRQILVLIPRRRCNLISWSCCCQLYGKVAAASANVFCSYLELDLYQPGQQRSCNKVLGHTRLNTASNRYIRAQAASTNWKTQQICTLYCQIMHTCTAEQPLPTQDSVQEYPCCLQAVSVPAPTSAAALKATHVSQWAPAPPQDDPDIISAGHGTACLPQPTDFLLLLIIKRGAKTLVHIDRNAPHLLDT